MSGAEKEQDAREKIQSWLMAEGWNIAEQAHPDLAWLIRAEDAGGRRILIGQNKARPDLLHLEARVNIADEHRSKFESLAEDKRREILWKLRFRLLMMNVDFAGVAEPMQAVLLTQRIYLDGLSKDTFIQRFLTVRNAVIAVIWSIMQDLAEESSRRPNPPSPKAIKDEEHWERKMGDPPADTTLASGRKRVIWDDSRSRNVSVNAFNVMSSREEISLLLGTSQAGQKEGDTVTVELTDRVALSPFTAKRFAIQLNHVIQEYESKYGSLGEEPPSPPKPSRPSAPGKTPPGPGAEDKAGVLFRLVENLKVEVGFEQSFKIVDANLLENRFLLGVSKKAIGQRADERLAETCNRMGMPKALRAVFSQYLPQGNYVHFGFEQNEQSAIYKVYLEFWERIKKEIERTKQRPAPALLHLGLKWDVSNPVRQAVTRYTWHPWLLPDEIQQRVMAILDPYPEAPPKQAADELISLALARAAHHDLLYLDVTEEGNPRRSFDINVYRAKLQVQEIYPLLSMLCRRHLIPFDSFHRLYDRIKTKRLGHLAAGADREGKDFFTLYYGVEDIFGERTKEPGRNGSAGSSTKYTPPARKRRVVRIEETDDKAGHLFQLVKKLRLRGGFEHSFKFLNGILLCDRFLFGVKRPAESAGHDHAIMDVCRQIDMPAEFQETFRSELHRANFVLFGFEKNETSRVYKAYLEFTGMLAEALKQDLRPENALIYVGFKWDVSDISRKVLAQYFAYPLFHAEEMAARVSRSIYGGARNDPYPIVDDILDLAGSRTQPGELLYFEATEEGNPRKSFDINLYLANLRMAEIYPLLLKMARHYSIDLGGFDERYEAVKDQKFGHLSGGTDRGGRDFLTVYFSQKGSSRQGIPLAKQ